MFVEATYLQKMLSKDKHASMYEVRQHAGHQLHGDRTWFRLMRWPQQVQYSEGGSNVSRLSPHALH